MKNWFLILLLSVLVNKVLASDVASDFSMANKLYAQGKFSDAVRAYETILGSGKTSASLLFNYGNAEFKSGNLGKAIAAYHRAELMAPHDSEIRANLNFVRDRVQGATVRLSFWQNWLGNLSLNEWTILAAVAFWLTFILLIARQIRPMLAAKFRGVFFASVSLTVLFAAISAVQMEKHFSGMAIVVLPEATARTGPFDDAQSAFVVRDGIELRVLDRHDDWAQVADGNGKIGWLNKKQVEILPGA